MTVPSCKNELPPTIKRLILRFAEEWATSEDRPKLTCNQLAIWDQLIEEWIGDKSLPIMVRKFDKGLPRGSHQIHESGRILIPTDNTPAHWAFESAWSGDVSSLATIASLLEDDKIPIAMILKTFEKSGAKQKCSGRKNGLNSKGWKLCHIDPVKVGKGNILTKPISDIENQFRRFISPRNMFLIPKNIGGLGEVTEVIEAVRHTISE